MKKLFFLAAFAFIGFNANSQVIVNDVNINELDVKYVELVGRSKINPTKIKVIVDYGQPFSFKSQAVRGAAGEKAAFNSMIDALNFMDANGWDFVSNYVIMSNGEVTTRYILQKRK
jgi:hypothetical protein